jgi:cobalt-zinc-cadmium efflux system membrane fusion protein
MTMRNTTGNHGAAGGGERRTVWRVQNILSLLIVGAVVGCGGSSDRVADSTAASADTLVGTVLFSAEQVQHGGVRWAPAGTGTVVGVEEVPGELAPDEDHTARLSAPARGRIVAVHVQLGDRVQRGDALVTLQGAEASAARADYAKAVAERESRRAAAAYAHAASERAQRLLVAKAIARQEVERAQADDELARSALAQAVAEVDRARAWLSQMGVDSVSGEMVLRAPMAGVVLSRDGVPGSVVEAGTLLLTVSDPGTLWLEVAVPGRGVGVPRPGARVRFGVPAFSTDTFEARVRGVGGAVDSATRTVPVRALVRNAAWRLRAGMFATVWLESGVARDGVVVPDSALQLVDGKPVVFVAQADGRGGARFERRAVAVGARAGGRVQIARGVAPGELVVVAGAFAVKSEFARSSIVGGE